MFFQLLFYYSRKSIPVRLVVVATEHGIAAATITVNRIAINRKQTTQHSSNKAPFYLIAEVFERLSFPK
jgi:hypothetical protein